MANSLLQESEHEEDQVEEYQPPTHHPSPPAHELFDISTTVDPSYVISLIRKLLPSDVKLGDNSSNGLFCQEPKTASVEENATLTQSDGEEEKMESSDNYGRVDKPEAINDDQNLAGEETWEENGCILWDLSAVEDHAQLMVQNLILQVLLANLIVSKSSRVTEISLGIIGNLACHELSRKQIISTNGLVRVIVDQLLHDDVPCLCEACRVITLCLQGGEGITWAEALQTEQILSRVLWIAENALNPLLIEKRHQILTFYGSVSKAMPKLFSFHSQSVGLLLAVLESQHEVAAILLPPMMILGLSSLLVNLLAFEMSKFRGERIPERYPLLDLILRAIEALSTNDHYSREICLNKELFQLLRELIKLPDKIEVASSCITAAVLIANILTDVNDLASELSQDLSFLQGLLDVFPFASDDTEAQTAMWSIIARLLILIQERDMSPSNLHLLVSILTSKLDMIEDEILVHQLDHGEHETTASSGARKDAWITVMKRISDILTRWKFFDEKTENSVAMEGSYVDERDIDKLLSLCEKASG